MTKKMLCLLTALLLCAVSAAFAESAVETVSAAELSALREDVLGQALAASPLNDPSDESARSEDGTFFSYEVARIYAEGTELTAETPVNALVFEDSEGPVFRGTGIDTQLADLLAAYPLDNAELAGTREEALLYLHKTEDGGFRYGRILRNGQRVSAAEYGEVLNEGGRFRRSAVTYTLLNGLVTSIRFDGLNPGAGLLEAEDASEILASLEELGGKKDYCAVKTSRNGLELTPLAADDLYFDGFAYAELQPDSLPGTPEKDLIDNEDGTWLLRCDGDGYEAVFRCDAEGNNAQILSLTLLSDEFEGPRCVRLGDLFSDDFCRFRNGENEVSEEMTELLYGTEGTAPWGYASYDPSAGETSLRYVTNASDGTVVELLLKYEQNTLFEIILHSI